MENTSDLKIRATSSWLTGLYKKLVLSAFGKIEEGYITVIEGAQTYTFGSEHSTLSCVITVLSDQMYKQFALGGSVGAGEAYIDGHWKCNDLTKMIEIFAINQSQLDDFERKFSALSGLANKLAHLKNQNSKAGSKKNIAAHYDLGNELYSAFLSKEMLYSSAIYQHPNTTLEQAQNNKLAVICRKLDIQATDKVVEIGTGWGAFAIYAAQNIGCHVTTTTISEEQYTYVENLIKRNQLESKITLLKSDYRELTGQFDKLVSIEMIEAVGHDYLPSFFDKCNRLLKPSGAMLIQAITIACQRYDHYLKKSDFIQQHIFPGGCLPSLEQMHIQIKNGTDMVVHEVSDIGLHYARTLNDWRVRFIEAWPKLDHSKFDERFKRLWLFYLSYCEGAFKQRATSTVHLIARKPRYVSTECKSTLSY
ncbi:cyclopropane-fatty-acyl-phospholipid synthase family protein [Pseudoalteromonas sp. MMG005]|uniref:SAM-dependent methyltransferase n=1 Tax=Pseudoalteromonas sp. MMG005 TaxID=2822682 RepID=UPI001B3A0CFE|nr:cyclopropane-fatty-acyl-phospholipid synthase family protein [Pseudoalteromonas sp. MMG005]MBQ4846824.1 class I SAM-dependent methyltransferase [Pseudoalteromonas sp. MMG005]